MSAEGVFVGQKSPGTFSADNETPQNLIQETYGVQSGQRNWLPYFVAPGQGVPIVGGPSWIGSERYDITAKWNAVYVADGYTTIESIGKAQSEMVSMPRTLLERRFRLKVHREMRDLPVYEMTVAKAGKLVRGNCTTFDPGKLPRKSIASDFSSGMACSLNSSGSGALALRPAAPPPFGSSTYLDEDAVFVAQACQVVGRIWLLYVCMVSNVRAASG